MESATIIRNIFKTFPEMVVVVDKEGNVVDGNKAFYDFFCNKSKKKAISKFKATLIDDIKSIIFKCQNSNIIEDNIQIKKQNKTIFFNIICKEISTKNNNLYLIILKDNTDEVVLERKIIQRNEELSILYEISKIEAENLGYKEIIYNVCKRLIELTNIEYASFLRYSLIQRKWSFINYNLEGNLKSLFENIAEMKRLPIEFKKEHATIIVNPQKRKHHFYKALGEQNIELIIILPIYSHDIYFGALFLLSHIPNIVRISESIKFFNLVSQQIGIALEKAKLFNELEESFREIDRKNKIFYNQLKLAQKMQTGLLSINFPKKPGISFAIKYIPSYLLGGDFYDVFEIPGNMIGVLIADVCGHGVSSALVTSYLKASVRDLGQNYREPSQLMTQLNSKLYQILPRDMFVTAFYIIIDINKHRIHYVNAGHPAPIFLKNNGKAIDLVGEGTVLSVLSKIEYKTYSLEYSHKEKLFLFTDGLYEVKDKENNILGRDKIKQKILDNATKSVSHIVETLVKTAYNFSGDKALNDDINIVGISFH